MKDIAKRVFNIEIESLKLVADALDDSFTKVVEAILATEGKVIVTGIGKSGIIGKKIAATLASTGTPSSRAIAIAATTSSIVSGMITPTGSIWYIEASVL